jgi:hypothetical protein
MGSTTFRQPAHGRDTPAFRRAAPVRRPPGALDWLLFFIGVPIGLAVMFSLVGTRLTVGMSYLDSFVYMLWHMFTAWWTVNAVTAMVKFSFRSWRPPVLTVCLLGVLFTMVPATFFFQVLGDYYAGLYPAYAANRIDGIDPSWTFAYLWVFLRGSLPVLPTFLIGVYGYRYVTGVDWYGYAQREVPVARVPDDESPESASDSSTQATLPATAQLIAGARLPPDARLIAIKAEQHYIKIWSDQGTDLVRYRFRDIAETLANCEGAQVHRSWWVSLDQVQSYRQAGRKLELIIEPDLTVPVSLSYKNAVLARLNAG